MAGLFYPYKSASDALAHLGPYADAAVGHGCGISYTDGRQISVLRRPAGARHAWLNVWRRRVAAPRPAPVKHQTSGAWHSVAEFFEHAIEVYGEQQMQQAQMQMAASQAMVGAIDRHVWQPTHAWLLKHKLFADTLAVTADVVGVVAGTVVMIVAGPELAAGAVIVGGAAIFGSLVLTAIDGTVLCYEIAGNEDQVKAVEGNEYVQWARIVGTVLTLPDLAVGGVQSLRDVATLPGEIGEARTAARTLSEAAEAQRARAAKIAHPAKHVHKVQQRLARANRLAKEAAVEAKLAHHRGNLLKAAKVGLVGSYGATPTGGALFAAMPPDIMLTQGQQKRDEATRSLAPEGGMPRDVRLDMRVSGVARTGH